MTEPILFSDLRFCFTTVTSRHSGHQEVINETNESNSMNHHKEKAISFSPSHTSKDSFSTPPKCRTRRSPPPLPATPPQPRIGIMHRTPSWTSDDYREELLREMTESRVVQAKSIDFDTLDVNPQLVNDKESNSGCFKVIRSIIKQRFGKKDNARPKQGRFVVLDYSTPLPPLGRLAAFGDKREYEYQYESESESEYRTC
ncbi:hypothetical protein NEOLI_004892 [Neolecta irregularis DAH-3]|uniref:Uncharacterized protein n=1 Tax=Neolecta irregularis (strain DAH-3) TaxID=1198029 RepID=A0A1U7LM53_NEOID|nr:hypothetical protein NEOLI_004892 [Neolecta irregularis DAH-3]|eukprot:OLL23719.1 hypothetical protein NEOLI_004892 [Neolecta irregularis DAH-3]